jgi:hypothetical protein
MRERGGLGSWTRLRGSRLLWRSRLRVGYQQEAARNVYQIGGGHSLDFIAILTAGELFCKDDLILF